ncbi:MAG: Hpt domain-containing protein [Pseudomonadota bacterium]
MIDWDQVKELEAEIGPEDFGDIVEVFIEEVDEAVAALEGVSLEGEALASAMHFLKGSSANLGFVDLAAYCSEGEIKAKEGASADVDLSKVIALYDASKSKFMAEASDHILYSP